MNVAAVSSNTLLRCSAAPALKQTALSRQIPHNRPHAQGSRAGTSGPSLPFPSPGHKTACHYAAARKLRHRVYVYAKTGDTAELRNSGKQSPRLPPALSNPVAGDTRAGQLLPLLPLHKCTSCTSHHLSGKAFPNTTRYGGAVVLWCNCSCTMQSLCGRAGAIAVEAWSCSPLC